MQYERVPSVGWFAEQLGVPAEAIRFAANRAGLKIDKSDSFLIPKTGAQRARFHQFLASRPCNQAEQLRSALGIKPRRAIPSE